MARTLCLDKEFFTLYMKAKQTKFHLNLHSTNG